MLHATIFPVKRDLPTPGAELLGSCVDRSTAITSLACPCKYTQESGLSLTMRRIACVCRCGLQVVHIHSGQCADQERSHPGAHRAESQEEGLYEAAH